PNAADAPAPRRLGAPTPATDRSPAPGCRVSNPVRGLGARKTAFCCASPTVPLAEPLPQTDPSAIRSTASEVVVTTAYRHRVTLEALSCLYQWHILHGFVQRHTALRERDYVVKA